MTSILNELYHNNYEMPFYPSAEYKKAEDELETLWNQVAEVFSLEFVDEIFNREAVHRTELDLHYYREGFRLGAMLMLELFTDSCRQTKNKKRPVSAKRQRRTPLRYHSSCRRSGHSKPAM